MKRAVPVVPTIIVALAALLMVRLGTWQLHRRHEKAALLAHYAANVVKPPLPLVALFPIDDDDLYRRTSGYCLDVTGWQMAAGRGIDGTTGWRHIALCRTGAEGPGFAVDVGVSATADKPDWKGGPVRGRLTWTTTGASIVTALLHRIPPRSPMIVSDAAAPGLKPTLPPNPGDLPNNHLSYAVQWFLFAGVAVAIYAVALWQRARRRAQHPE